MTGPARRANRLSALAFCWLIVLSALAPGVASAQEAGTAARRDADLSQFAEVFNHFRDSYVTKLSDADLVAAAIDGLIDARPDASGVADALKVRSKMLSPGADDSVDAYLKAFDGAFDNLRDAGATAEDDRALVRAGIDALIATLDIHSSYYDARKAKEFQAQNAGQFGGLGIEVTIKDELVGVVAPLDDSPAARAGIQAGDLITHIDGQSLRGMELAAAVAKMRGKVGSAVEVTIERQGVAEPFAVEIVRDTIKLQSVRRRAEGDVGVLRVSYLSEGTAEALKQAIAALRAEMGDALKGFVLDLRNNPGGLLGEAIPFADLFLERGEITSLRGREASDNQRFEATPGDATDGLPLVALINQGTSSGAEIIVGALRDHRRASVVGMQSFGKGSAQTIYPLKSGDALRITTGYFYLPSGEAVEGGVAPDLVVEREGDGANQLDAAMQLARGVPLAELQEKLKQEAVASAEPADDAEPLGATELAAKFGKRVALVIGNSAYQHTPPLSNPKNDAADIAAALTRLGFDVIHEHDLSKADMDDSFRRFAREVRDADAAVFYYAGHAMQLEGVNYLMPIDATLEDEVDVPYEMAKVDDVVADMARMSGVRIAILDSCRNNPLEQRLKRSVARTRGVSQPRGLARIARPDGLIVAYSTTAGDVADDGTGRNSPFTEALLEHIETQGLEVGPMFRRVMRSVREATGGDQHPELSVLFDGEFYFRPE